MAEKEDLEQYESNVKSIQMFKTDDGSIYEQKEDAVKHQQYIDFWQEITTLITESHQICSYENDTQDILGFIWENRKALSKIIAKYPLAESMLESDYP